MDFNWINLIVTVTSTFGAALAGSWFGAKATNKQTAANFELEKKRFYQSAAFEFLSCLDEYRSISYRKDDGIKIQDRDKICHRMITLISIVLPEKAMELKSIVWDIRKIHVGGKARLNFDEVDDQYFEVWRQETIKKHFPNQ